MNNKTWKTPYTKEELERYTLFKQELYAFAEEQGWLFMKGHKEDKIIGDERDTIMEIVSKDDMELMWLCIRDPEIVKDIREDEEDPVTIEVWYGKKKIKKKKIII